MQAGANRTHWAAASAGGFFITHLFQLADQNRLADLLDAFTFFGNHHWGQRIFWFSPGGPVGINLVQGILPRQSLQMPHYTVTRDAEKKCAKLTAIRLKLLWLPDQEQEDFLHDFFRSPRRTGHAQSIAIERRLMLLVEREKCLFVSAYRLPEQRRLFLVHESHHSG